MRGLSRQSLRNVIRNGIPAAGMPAFDLPAGTIDALATLVASLNASAAESAVPATESPAKSSSLERDSAPPATWSTARDRRLVPIYRMSRER